MNPAAAGAAAALLPAAVVDSQPIGQGHINTTVRVFDADDGSWCLQRLNPNFADERMVMTNVEMVVSQLRRVGHPTIELAATSDGCPWHVDDEGGVWRAYRWLPGTAAADHPAPRWTEIAQLVGAFVAAVAELDDSQVATVVDRFHDPLDRWTHLEEAVTADRAGRVHQCSPDLRQLRSLATRIWDETPAARWTDLPRQIVHNDTKAANVVVDQDGSPVALIDLDTTMMGSPLNDLGEFVRGCGAVEGPEGPAVLAQLALSFAAGMARPLTAPEWAGLVSAGAVMSFENSVRAMTDHLDGDRYYDLGEGVNLARCQRHLHRSEQLLAMAPAAAVELDRLDEHSPSRG
ncbi:MAG: phosphotransferase enzyme family protein [Acidimicrobiales bacterium]